MNFINLIPYLFLAAVSLYRSAPNGIRSIHNDKGSKKRYNIKLLRGEIIILVGFEGVESIFHDVILMDENIIQERNKSRIFLL